MFHPGTVLQSNEKLAKKLETTPLPKFVYHKIKTTDGAYGKYSSLFSPLISYLNTRKNCDVFCYLDIWVREMRPPDFQANRKYAVLFDV